MRVSPLNSSLPRRVFRCFTLFTLASFAVLPATVAGEKAAEPEPAVTRSSSAPETAAAEPAPSTEAAGLVIYVDPATGAVVEHPTPEQERALAEKRRHDPLARSDEGLVPFALEGGGTGVHLGGRFQSALVVHRHADGRWVYGCRHADGGETAGDPEAVVPGDQVTGSEKWPVR